MLHILAIVGIIGTIVVGGYVYYKLEIELTHDTTFLEGL